MISISQPKNLRMGVMQRIRLKQPILPDISPNLQGCRAYDLLTDEQKGMLKFALADAAKIEKCRIEDLEWSFGRNINGVAPLNIKKKKRIEL